MSDPALTSYEQIPYESAPILGAHPDNMASLATLFGMEPPALEGCRVLELGCATGGNLVAIADSLPGSQSVGVDLSPSQIAAGQKLCAALALKNVELRAGSILEVGSDWGQFDYIICHGVYSWVPAEVQEQILTICARNLAPNGVAYVSYNVYPGWHIAGMIRDMVSFHGRRYADPHDRINQVRKFLDFLTGLVKADPGNTLYYNLLANQVEDLRDSGDSYVFHEYLEDVNQPVYFHEFARRAAEKGLQFVTEAQISAMAGNLPADVKDTLHGWSDDYVEYEQYLDFVRNRRFRKSLLCHADVKLNRVPGPEVVRKFRFTAQAQPLRPTLDPAPDGSEQFRTRKGLTFTTNSPWIRTAAHLMWAAAPCSVPYAELERQVAAALPEGLDADSKALEVTLLRGVLSGLFEVHLFEPKFVTELSLRPTVSPLARVACTRLSWVTNRRHRMFELDGLHKQLIPLMDGSRDREALIETIAARVRDGMPLLDENDQPVRDPDEVRRVVGRGVDQVLERLAKSALLVA
jgi:SAM-dependent methyltransferase